LTPVLLLALLLLLLLAGRTTAGGLQQLLEPLLLLLLPAVPALSCCTISSLVAGRASATTWDSGMPSCAASTSAARLQTHSRNRQKKKTAYGVFQAAMPQRTTGSAGGT
jgi:hypothetical protein